jgi:antirestriction protein
MATQTHFNGHDDVLDLRDLSDRLDGLREQRDAGEDMDAEDVDDLTALEALAEEFSDFRAAAENEPTLVDEYYWQRYAEDYFGDVYGHEVPEFMQGYIDYERFARDLRMDYTAVELGGRTYYTRAY